MRASCVWTERKLARRRGKRRGRRDWRMQTYVLCACGTSQCHTVSNGPVITPQLYAWVYVCLPDNTTTVDHSCFSPVLCPISITNNTTDYLLAFDLFFLSWKRKPREQEDQNKSRGFDFAFILAVRLLLLLSLWEEFRLRFFGLDQCEDFQRCDW